MAAFKNFSEPVKAIAEMHRVLKDGGTALIYDLSPDVTDEALARYTRQVGRGHLESLWMTWIFKYFLARRAHSKDDFHEMAVATPFKTCEVHDDLLSLGFEVVLRRSGT
jgi:ubiquinone/menaquinone biosynthesis C-methylase UbiE